MPGSYNLRSLQKKEGNLIRNCYLQKHSIKSPDAFNPKVCLERLKLLECHNIKNGQIYVDKGRITIKKNKSILLNKKYLIRFFCTVFLMISSIIYWRDYLQSHSITFVKKFSEIHPGVQNLYLDAIKFHLSITNQSNYKQEKINVEDRKSAFDIPNEKMTLLVDNDSHIRKLVKNYVMEIKKNNKIQNIMKSSKSFIEEQCSNNLINNFSWAKNTDYTKIPIDLINLTDYALESQGAKIVTVFNTELYGTITVKYINFNLWPKLTHFLMKYMKCFSSNGPNSVLIPWKKPGDCWAFKGSYGRVQIQLSEEIFVSAISIDHIPREAAPNGSIKSAPKKFSIAGIKENETEIIKTHLGTYEYKSTGPDTQTFVIQPEVKIPYRKIEVIIESNHGNKDYTCVYKIRVHGHK